VVLGTWHCKTQEIFEKANASAFPFQKIEKMTRKLNETQIRFARNQSLRKEEVGGRGHHV
jgi:hypothetical protein